MHSKQLYLTIHCILQYWNYRVQAKSFEIGVWTFFLEFKSRRGPKNRGGTTIRKNCTIWTKNVNYEVFADFNSEFWSAAFSDKKRVPLSKNTPWLNEKVFSDLNSEFWSAAFSDEKRVPLSKNTPWLNEKVFLDLSSEFWSAAFSDEKRVPT